MYYKLSKSKVYEDLQVWKGVINNSDLDDMLLLRNVRIDAEGKLDEASLRLAAQLPISHENWKGRH